MALPNRPEDLHSLLQPSHPGESHESLGSLPPTERAVETAANNEIKRQPSCDDEDAMSRAAEDVLAFVDHFHFPSSQTLPIIATTETMSTPERIVKPPPPSTAALLDRTNLLFPDMTPFQKRRPTTALPQHQYQQQPAEVLPTRIRPAISPIAPVKPSKPVQEQEQAQQPYEQERTIQAERYEQQAWEERAAARQWAADLRGAVHKWVQEQRKSMLVERQALAASQTQIDRYRQALAVQQETVSALERDLTDSRQRYEAAEKQLYEVIQYQQSRLLQLEDAMKDQESKPTRTMPSPSRPSAPLPPKPKQQASPPATEQAHTPRSVTISPEQVRPVAIPKIHAAAFPPVVDTSATPRPRMRRVSNGTELISYGNGSTKEIHPDGTTVTKFANGDIKTHRADTNTTSYHYAACNVTRISCQDGSTVLEFPKQGQTERHWPDGRKLVSFADGTTQRVAADGTAETLLADQSAVHVERTSGETQWVQLAADDNQ